MNNFRIKLTKVIAIILAVLLTSTSVFASCDENIVVEEIGLTDLEDDEGIPIEINASNENEVKIEENISIDKQTVDQTQKNMIVQEEDVNQQSEEITQTSKYGQVALGYYHSAVIKSDKTLWTWGNNDNGQLGDGSTTTRNTPVKIMDDVVSVSLGAYHSAAIKTDGSLWMWGVNSDGELGDGTTSPSNKPKKIMDNVVQVSLGEAHSAAIKTDGSLWMWGNNSCGQLGDGTTTKKKKPVKILSGVKQISLGNTHSAAIKTDGSLWTWGWNWVGQLGDSSFVDNYKPKKIMTGVAQVSLGYAYSAAVKTDGSLWTWGGNICGRLGNGSKDDCNIPNKILEGVKQVCINNGHSAAIKTDGSLWMWGDNFSGELGTGNNSDSLIPQKVISDVDEVSVGAVHSAAIKTDGSLWMWGNNYNGQLGDGSEINKNIPVLIFSLKVNPNININKYLMDFELGRDTFNFANSVDDIGVALEAQYPISKEDWDAFLSNNKYNLMDKANIYDSAKQFGGVCAGMSSILIQNYYDSINLMDLRAELQHMPVYFLYGLWKPVLNNNLQKQIGLNQYVVAGSKYDYSQEEFTKNYKASKAIEYLYELSSEIDHTNKPIYIDFSWVKKISDNGDVSNSAHAVVAYGIETKGAPYTYGGQKYAYRILTADPNEIYNDKDDGKVEHCIYLSEGLDECVIPKTGTSSDNLFPNGLKYNHGKMEKEGDFMFQLITDDIDKIMSRGSRPLTQSQQTKIIMDSSFDKLNDKKIDFINVTSLKDYRSYRVIPGNSSEDETRVLILNTDKCKLSTKNGGHISLIIADTFVNVSAENPADIQLNSDHSISLNTSGLYKIKLVNDKISLDNNVNSITLTGENAQNLHVHVSDNQVDVSSDNLQGIHVKTGDVLESTEKETTIKEKMTEVSISANSNGNTIKEVKKNEEIKKLSTPKLISIEKSNSSLVVKWNKVSNASGYIIYRKTNNGAWKKIKLLGNKLSYKDTSVKVGYNYSYTVKAYKSINGTTINSGYNKNGLSGKLNTNITVSCNPQQKYVKIVWKKTTGANGYYIYRSTSKNGKYNKIKTITKGTILKYTDSKLKQGVTYYYKVTPYATLKGRRISGSSSGIKKVKYEVEDCSGAIPIYTANQLIEVSKNPTKNYVLMKDISLKGISWEIIGNSNPYSGVFNGNNHEIRDYKGNGGLFACVTGEIKNLTVSGTIEKKGTDKYSSDIGSIVNLLKGGKITNCTSNVNIIFKGSVYENNKQIIGLAAIGGIVGHMDNHAQLLKCVNNGTVDVEGSVLMLGGVVGNVYESGNIINCENKGNISMNQKDSMKSIWDLSVGGVVGYSSKINNNATIGVTITDSRNTGNIECTFLQKGNVGGISGRISDSNIYNSINDGKIKCIIKNKQPKLNVGGIVGFGISTKIRKSQNKGKIFAQDSIESHLIEGSEEGVYVGGIIGYATYDKPENCVNTGLVDVVILGNCKKYQGSIYGYWYHW